MDLVGIPLGLARLVWLAFRGRNILAETFINTIMECRRIATRCNKFAVHELAATLVCSASFGWRHRHGFASKVQLAAIRECRRSGKEAIDVSLDDASNAGLRGGNDALSAGGFGPVGCRIA